jgi:hypothetical protein
MPWSVPDKGEGLADVQSILFQEYMDAIVDGVSGVNFVCAGCDVTAQGSPDMTCAVSAGVACSNDTYFSVTAGNVTITTAHATLPRFDLVVVDSAGAKAVRAGTAATNPKPPNRTANDVLLAAVYVPAADTTIATNQITGLRILRPERPRMKALASAHVNSTTTGTEVTGLGPIVLEPGTYTFTYSLFVQSAAAATGFAFGINFTGTSTKQQFLARMVDSLGTTASGIAASVVGAAGTGNAGTYVSALTNSAKSTTAPNMVNIGFVGVATDALVIIEGVIVVTATGDLELWHAAEVAASNTVGAGSSVVVMKTG